MDEEKSSISDFYRDKSILLTGGTSFLGKVLIEKLLRSCPDIKTIYLLLRPKKRLDVKQRLEALFQSKLFDRVKREQPNAIIKVVAIQGDITADRLGIYPSDEKLITDNVSVVFHAAATMQYDCALKKVFDSNVLGTRRLVELCRNIRNLEALVYLSTMFLKFEHETMEEVPYNFPIPPRKIIDTIEWMNEGMARDLSLHLLKGPINAYSYTKALTEAFLAEECYDLPVAIIRPSSIAATWKEPFPGWVDNCNATTDFIAAICKGFIQCLHCKTNATADFIPVDIVANLFIAAAWNTANQRPKNITVYNFACRSMNKITWEDTKRHLLSAIHRYPSTDIFRYPKLIYTSNKTSKFIFVNLFHNLPGYFYDFLYLVRGRKPRFVQMYKSLHQVLHFQGHFFLHDLKYTSKNVLKLQEKLSPEDAKVFDFNIRSMSWPAYLEGYVLGIRQYLQKEPPSSLKPARKKLERLLLYEKFTNCICIAFILVLLIKILWG